MLITIKVKDHSKISDFVSEPGTKEDLSKKIEEILNDAENQIHNIPNSTVCTLFPPKNQGENTKVKLYQDDWMQQYIGVLYYKDPEDPDKEYILRIQSRFDKENQEELFSKYIIYKTLGEGAYILVNDLFKEGSAADMEQLLAVVFVRQIHQAFKKGIFRKYRNYECNDPKVKGTIDVARHIRLNPMFNGNIAYSYRELTADNDVNRLIFTTYKMMEKKYPFLKGIFQHDQNAKDYVSLMDRIMTPASRSEINSLLKKSNQKINHPLYHEWESVRQTAIMIQRHMGNLADMPNKSQIAGVLIDMDTAWESYLKQIFNKATASGKYDLHDQKSFPILDGKRSIRPDFCWEKTSSDKQQTNSYALILDAKNKPRWGEVIMWELKNKYKHEWNDSEWNDIDNGNKDNRIREDLYEVFSYMYVLKCGVGGIVCPLESNKPEIQATRPLIISNFNSNEFYVFGFPVELSKTSIELSKTSKTDFEKYEEIMAVREKDMETKINGILSPQNE